MTTLSHLECSLCGKKIGAGEPRSLCDCGGILLARYDLDRAREGYSREWLAHAPASMWRYMPLLPVANPGTAVSLGEGLTPFLKARRLGEVLGIPNLWVKDEGLNPAGSVEARGFSCAVTMAVAYGTRAVGLSSGGQTAAALAAYAAAAGIEAQIQFPPGASSAAYIQCRAAGARVMVSDDPSLREAGFDLDAFKEPYRLEGVKTLGYELAEQSRWDLPDVILCPTGDGLELIGLWKAFEEMEAVGWIQPKRPRMIAVHVGPQRSLFAERLVASTLAASGGFSVEVTLNDAVDAGLELASTEGVFAGVEGAAGVATLRRLAADGSVRPEERVAIVIPSVGYQSLDVYATRFAGSAAEQDKLGGLITPR